jgi:hypothetical protein
LRYYAPDLRRVHAGAAEATEMEVSAATPLLIPLDDTDIAVDLDQGRRPASAVARRNRLAARKRSVAMELALEGMPGHHTAPIGDAVISDRS